MRGRPCSGEVLAGGEEQENDDGDEDHVAEEFGIVGADMVDGTGGRPDVD